MPLNGQLSKEKFGYSVPVDSPLYTPFPLYYEDVRILLFPYLTDANAAAALVPSQFELILDPSGKYAIAQVVCAKYPFSNIGGYNEVAQTVLVSYKGTIGTYAIRLHVTNDQAMAAGREIGGFPKKLGVISFDEGPTYLSTLETPSRLQVLTAELDAVQPVAGNADRPTTFFSLRVIPNPVDEKTPSICQLIQTVWELYDGTFWSGRGALHFNANSGLNPYHVLPVLQLLPGLNTNPKTPAEAMQPGVGLFRGKMKIAQVTVLEDF